MTLKWTASLLVIWTAIGCGNVGDDDDSDSDSGPGGKDLPGSGGDGSSGGNEGANGGSGAETGTGGTDPVGGYYFDAGDWQGYGFTDSGPTAGGVVSELSGGFVSGTTSACVSGTLAEAYGSLGIIGMSLNQALGSETLGEWTPGEYKGVKVEVTRNLDTALRLEILTADGTGYCRVLGSDETTITWSSFKTECWGSGGTTYDPTIPLTKIQFYAPGNENSVVSFDYCVDVLEPVKDTGSVLDPDHKFVGNITTNYNVRSDFIDYWDQITPENEGKWDAVEGTRDEYTWEGVDRAYNYAMEHGIPFKQHTFVWGSQYPSWISGLPPSEQAAEIEEWMEDFCDRYPETALIDVVNEATPGHAPADFAASAFGSDWIIESFQLARKHCPNAVLILNDYNVLTWNTDQFIAMAKPAVDAGVVDAIGLQAHGFAEWSLNDLQNNFNKIVALGLPIYITEYDLDIANDTEQAQVMEEQFTFFYEHESVKGITLWGYVVGATWVDNSGLIYDNGTHRPAMTWLMNYLGR